MVALSWYKQDGFGGGKAVVPSVEEFEGPKQAGRQPLLLDTVGTEGSERHLLLAVEGTSSAVDELQDEEEGKHEELTVLPLSGGDAIDINR